MASVCHKTLILEQVSFASMIDNLQIHYLEQLELALETTLHGRVSAGVDILLELRLKPDLSMYTRAMVNLSLADLTTFEQHPGKIKFAREGLRLGKELQVCWATIPQSKRGASHDKS